MTNSLIKHLDRLLWIAVVVAVAVTMVTPKPAAASDTRSLVLLLRHAYAPGGGDPDNFDLNDCSTQRNLSHQGREQARDIGRQLKSLGIKPTAVWSSQWCRSFETAELMNVGQVQALPALNSFFQNRAAGPSQMRELQSFLKKLDPAGGPYIMSSHQVVVSAIANTWVNSGDGVWLELTGNPDDPWRIYPAKTETLSLPPGF
ncbi:histidine phosphatase family protein [Orrella daihaiensis]|uniref:Histidine phosphatase family protein n=1 Tax=Orrella daihaiensis TaxID=2782176 RepID=A0ABY4AIS5_9BURK|nr:histidine phosphatase family protein [Orrella daihaiensis]UOD49295.1 histidine phosphatase family protein [Orrella daihaiensis]